MASITPVRRATRGTISHIADCGGTATRLGLSCLTISIAAIFLWLGFLGFITFEARGLVGIIPNDPLSSWLCAVSGQSLGAARFPGVFEIAASLFILGRLRRFETPGAVRIDGRLVVVADRQHVRDAERRAAGPGGHFRPVASVWKRSW